MKFEYDTIYSMTRSVLAFILFNFLFLSLSFAGPQDDRRIEENKREKLEPTELHYHERQSATEPSSLQELDKIYLSELELRKMTYRYDLLKIFVILMNVENKYIDMESQIAFLKEQKLLPKKFKDKNFDPMPPLRKGLAASMVRKLLKLRGDFSLLFFPKASATPLRN